MHLPSRRPAPSPGSVERVRRLLAPPDGGWVPPPALPAVGGEPPPSAAPPVDEPDDGLVESPGSAVDDELDDVGPVPEHSWRGGAGAASPPRSHAAGLLTGLLPAVTGGRVDPGRRGAAALVAVALLAAAVAGVVVLRGQPQEVPVPRVVSSGVPLPGASATAEQSPGAEVVVSVAGKVKRPGLVRLPAGSRVDDAVRAAGGPSAGASAGLLNLARKLVDGEQVLVGVDAPAAAAGPTGGGRAAGALLDLNTAAVGDFDALPGIGPVLAQRILDWRTEHGRFASVEQLREVTGIGESKYADLKGKVTV